MLGCLATALDVFIAVIVDRGRNDCSAASIPIGTEVFAVTALI
jgi:hypothetical protein